MTAIALIFLIIAILGLIVFTGFFYLGWEDLKEENWFYRIYMGIVFVLGTGAIIKFICCLGAFLLG